MPSVDLLALICLALLATGYVLFVVLGRVPALAGTIRQAWPILHVETAIVGTVVLAAWAGWHLGLVFTLFALILAARCMVEAATIARKTDPALPASWVWAVGVPAAGAVLTLVPGDLGLFGVALVWLALLVIRLIAGTRWASVEALNLLLFPALPLVIFVTASFQREAIAIFLVAFVLVETFDSYALLGGKLFGRRKAFPHLSPNKTVEGLAIGAVALVVTTWAVGALTVGIGPGQAVGLALLAGAATVAGDLVASALKRRAGVKDFATLVPHQGGILDIADAWIATSAVLILALAMA